MSQTVFDPSLRSTVCNLFMPASENLATCYEFGCRMNCCIVRYARNLFRHSAHTVSGSGDATPGGSTTLLPEASKRQRYRLQAEARLVSKHSSSDMLLLLDPDHDHPELCQGLKLHEIEDRPNHPYANSFQLAAPASQTRRNQTLVRHNDTRASAKIFTKTVSKFREEHHRLATEAHVKVRLGLAKGSLNASYESLMNSKDNDSDMITHITAKVLLLFEFGFRKGCADRSILILTHMASTGDFDM